MILKFNNYEKGRRTPYLNLSPQAGRGGRLLTRPKSLHRDRENRYPFLNPTHSCSGNVLELEQVTFPIAQHHRLRYASPFARERIELRVATKAVPPAQTRLLSTHCLIRCELDGSKTAIP